MILTTIDATIITAQQRHWQTYNFIWPFVCSFLCVS